MSKRIDTGYELVDTGSSRYHLRTWGNTKPLCRGRVYMNNKYDYIVPWDGSTDFLCKRCMAKVTKLGGLECSIVTVNTLYLIMDGRAQHNMEQATVCDTCASLEEAGRRIMDWPCDHVVVDSDEWKIVMYHPEWPERLAEKGLKAWV